jgi:hypothetical protein
MCKELDGGKQGLRPGMGHEYQNGYRVIRHNRRRGVAVLVVLYNTPSILGHLEIGAGFGWRVRAIVCSVPHSFVHR